MQSIESSGMDIIQRNFFRILCSGAFGTQSNLEPMSPFKWRRLIQMVEAQQVMPIFINGIARHAMTQNEMLHIMRPYEKELPGGVFHCFTGNQKEAEAFLRFDRFVLGVGGVSTFKSSHLREDLPAAVPLDRIVLETDSPYMAPGPHRGKRNESAFIVEVMRTLALSYGVDEAEFARQTNENVCRVFGVGC